MKRFIISILTVTVFFLGLGALVEKTGAKFKSDKKALELVAKARTAIGGDAAISAVQSLRIVGMTTRTSKVNGVDQTEQGDTEIALQLPDKYMRSTRMGPDDSNGQLAKIVSDDVNVTVMGSSKDDNISTTVDTGQGTGVGSGSGVAAGTNAKRVFIMKDDGKVQEVTGAQADKVIVADGRGTANFEYKTDGAQGGQGNVMIRRDGPGDARMAPRSNDLFKSTLSLLLTAPQGADVSYTYGGEADVDGSACDVVNAGLDGTIYKLYLSRDTSLPVMLVYTGAQMPQVVTFKRDDAPAGGAPAKVLLRQMDPGTNAPVEYQVKFSDYRTVSGVQLPFHWTQTVGGAADETFDVTSYEINPANIADRFQNQKIMIRTKKPDNQ